ncbi:hypothetical protein F5X96DRAFT_666553 [Biscogniauxia mediterranea]|nr:hypothetical protein F5X96DRAFT_666553 [Biscogniauxia mediterranea]
MSAQTLTINIYKSLFRYSLAERTQWIASNLFAVAFLVFSYSAVRPMSAFEAELRSRLRTAHGGSTSPAPSMAALLTGHFTSEGQVRGFTAVALPAQHRHARNTIHKAPVTGRRTSADSDLLTVVIRAVADVPLKTVIVTEAPAAAAAPSHLFQGAIAPAAFIGFGKASRRATVF